MTGTQVAVPGLDDPRVSKGSRSSSYSSTSLDHFASRLPLTPAIICASALDPYKSLTSSPHCLEPLFQFDGVSEHKFGLQSIRPCASPGTDVAVGSGPLLCHQLD